MWYTLTAIFVLLIITLCFSLCKAASKEDEFLSRIENKKQDN